MSLSFYVKLASHLVIRVMPVIRQGGHHRLSSNTICRQGGGVVSHGGDGLRAVPPHLGIIVILVHILLLIAAVGEFDQQGVLAALQSVAVKHLDDVFALLFALHPGEANSLRHSRRVSEYAS